MLWKSHANVMINQLFKLFIFRSYSNYNKLVYLNILIYNLVQKWSYRNRICAEETLQTSCSVANLKFSSIGFVCWWLWAVIFIVQYWNKIQISVSFQYMMYSIFFYLMSIHNKFWNCSYNIVFILKNKYSI